MTAFYAYCRIVDDAVDQASDPTTAREKVQALRRELDAVYDAKPHEPVFQALKQAVERFRLRREVLSLVLDGVEEDLDRVEYETFEDLYRYCYRVGSSVGLVCVAVLGDASRETERFAELTGVAVQWTNILRDVGEDAGRARIYLPLEDLRAFGVSRAEVLARVPTDAFARLMRFEAARVRHLYRLGAASLSPGARRRLGFALALRDIYRALLDRLEQEGFPVFERTVRLSKVERLAIAARSLLKAKVFR